MPVSYSAQVLELCLGFLSVFWYIQSRFCHPETHHQEHLCSSQETMRSSVVFDILLPMPWYPGSDDVASEPTPAARGLTIVPLECAVLAMTVTLLTALSCDGPDLSTALQEQAGFLGIRSCSHGR